MRKFLILPEKAVKCSGKGGGDMLIQVGTGQPEEIASEKGEARSLSNDLLHYKILNYNTIF